MFEKLHAQEWNFCIYEVQCTSMQKFSLYEREFSRRQFRACFMGRAWHTYLPDFCSHRESTSRSLPRIMTLRSAPLSLSRLKGWYIVFALQDALDNPIETVGSELLITIELRLTRLCIARSSRERRSFGDFKILRQDPRLQKTIKLNAASCIIARVCDSYFLRLS